MKEILLKFIKSNKWYLIIQVTFVLINIYFGTYPAKIVGSIVDLLYDINANQEKIISTTIYLLIISFALLIIRLPWRFLVGYLTRKLEIHIKDSVFRQFLKLKISEIQNIKNGEIMSYFAKDAQEIKSAFNRIISYGTRIIATFFIVTFSMAQGVDLVLTIVTLLPMTITIYLIIKIRKNVEKSFANSQKHFTKLSEFVQESTNSIRTTKAYTLEGMRLKEFIRKNRHLKQSNNLVDVYQTLLSTCINVGFGLCYGISLLYGSKLVLDGTITIGNFVTFNGCIGLFLGPVQWLPSLIARTKRGQISYTRLDQFLKLEKEKILPLNEKEEISLNGDIEISNLTFHYPTCLENTLENITITVPQGNTLGIIGSVGSGKTTLMNLLLRLYTIPNGMIKIGKKDINDIPIDLLRKNICYITQDNFLFSNTIESNIRLFKEGYEEKDIINSTKDAMIYDEIQEMENGIYSIIGEKGIDLSGGQKQRIAISRAFLNQADIIIFDDTFSALDNKTQKSLLENVKKMSSKKTCFIISSKISDIKDADNIIVLEYGKIIEQGTHENLIKEEGKYYQYYKQQITKPELEEQAYNI